MRILSRNQRWMTHLFGVLAFASCLAIAPGCGGDDAEEKVSDPQVVLAQFDDSRKRHDPLRFVEVELGEFFATKSVEGKGIVTISFKLYGVVSEQHRDELEQKKKQFEKRMRDAILTEVGKASLDDLTEPHMALLRSKLLGVVNRSTHTRLLRDVVFSSFAMEQT